MIPEQGTPEFDIYLQALQRNGFNLNTDTAWRVAHQACEGGIPGFIGYELIAQGVIGPGAQQRLINVAMQYACRSSSHLLGRDNTPGRGPSALCADISGWTPP